MHSALARRELCQLAGKLGRRNHNATSECLPPWPRSVVRSADFLPARAGRKQQRLRKRCGPKQSAATDYWLAFVVAMVVMGKYPPTRRIRTNNDLPARAALCAPQPAAAFLGGRRLAHNPFFVAGLELKRELVAGDLRDPVDDLIAIVIIAVVYTTAPGCLIERRTSRSRGRSWARGSSSSSACAVAIGRWIHGRRRSIDGRIRY